MDGVTKLVSRRAVVIFGTSSGNICHTVAELFRNLGVDSLKVVELDKDPRGKEMEKALLRLGRGGHNSAFPAVFIAGRLVGSAEAGEVMSLHLHGTLVPMLWRIGAILE